MGTQMFKPEVLYHGSATGGIQILLPRGLSHPSIEPDAPPSVYAGDDRAYAAGFGFRWSMEEGFGLGYTLDPNGAWRLILDVPKGRESRLEQPVYIYHLPADTFGLLDAVEPRGHNYRSLVEVKPLHVETHRTVRNAVERYGGLLNIYEGNPRDHERLLFLE